MGLGAGQGFDSSQEKRRNFVDQIYERGLIEEKVFGFHTKPYNATYEDPRPSEVRLGGINQDLFKAGHDLFFIDTLGVDTWEIPLKSLKMSGENLLRATSSQGGGSALINPGYPFIAAPIEEFDHFKKDLQLADPDDKLSCSAWDWCFFQNTTCEDVAARLPPLVFEFGTKEKS